MADAEEHAPRASKAGRNLPAAIGVGLLLGAVVVVSLFTVKRLFVALAILAVMAAVFELTRAIGATGSTVPAAPTVPRFPMIVGAAAVLVATYVGGTKGSAGGAESLVVATMLLGVAAVICTCVTDRSVRLASIAAGLFSACYVVFLAGFAILLVIPDDGARRVVALVATVAASDTGGYGVGVFLGKHPMAPTVSPKKSWEGFAGSTAACALCGGLVLPLTLHATWWQGVLFGLAIVVAATVGDLGESLVKRDLGIKDMGNVLPGHGGVLDRIDALLLAAPVAWALLTFFVPWPS